jgi:hypothetical protein
VNATLGTASAHLIPLADVNANKVTPGLIGFIVFALIGGATWMLMRNMSKQLKKIDFEVSPRGGAPAAVPATRVPSAVPVPSAAPVLGDGPRSGDAAKRD